MGNYKRKSAKSIDKKSFKLVGKLKKKTERSFDKFVDRKVVDEKLLMKNLLTQ